jgi:hypothetical protein
MGLRAAGTALTSCARWAFSHRRPRRLQHGASLFFYRALRAGCLVADTLDLLPWSRRCVAAECTSAHHVGGAPPPTALNRKGRGHPGALGAPSQRGVGDVGDHPTT